MSVPLTLNVVALMSLLPAALVPLRSNGGRDRLFWVVLALAVVGPALFSAALLAGAWRTDFGTAIWISVTASSALFAVLALASRHGWRLAPLLMPYLAIMGGLGTVVRGAPQPMVGGAPAVWLDLHILVSVLTYAMLTLAGVAALAAFLQERALKRKRPTALTRMLPAVMESETLAGRLLTATFLVLGMGLATGMATQYFETGVLLQADHKTLLSLLAFVLIGALLAGHRVCGIRGRIAARVVLAAWLAVTLAFPGVKFVTQVLL